MSRKPNRGKELTPEYIELIRVKPEDIAERLANLPYTITPRPDEKPPKGIGYLWCCYEAKWSKFDYHKDYPNSSLTRCLSCGISVEDYHIKNVNKLWGDKIGRQEK